MNASFCSAHLYFSVFAKRKLIFPMEIQEKSGRKGVKKRAESATDEAVFLLRKPSPDLPRTVF